MKQVLTFFLSILFLSAVGQEKVELDSVKNYNGKTVEVRGKVAKISSFDNGKSQQIIIYIGGESPNEKLSVILNSEDKGEPHYLLKDKRFAQSLIIVIGKIEIEKGKARIMLKNDQNLRFIVDEEVHD